MSAETMAWYFVSVDDDGKPTVSYCPSPGAIELAVREWMGGDPDAVCLADDDEDMARGVRDELLQQGVFRPEGDPPCYLLPAQTGTAFLPEPIVKLNECRARGWEDGALAYRSGWNDCRRAALGEEPLGFAGCYELATSVGVKS